MSLFGMMGTAVSGLTAQSNRLSTVADNISNANTTGYKRATTEFETLLGDQTPGTYSSGGVNTAVRYGVTDQGILEGTTSVTDLAIQGNGFFVVSDASGALGLTRAGSFVPDASGNLVNTAGYYLMGYPLTSGGSTTGLNGTDGLQIVNTQQANLQATASTAGTFAANLPSNSTVVAAADLPSAYPGGTTYTDKTSITTYDNLGNVVTLDVYTTNAGGGNWDVAIYNQADATPGTGFPYANAPLATQTLQFDPTTGNLATGSPTSVTVPIPNGQNLTLDMSSMTQLAADYTVNTATANGSAPSKLDHVDISTDGTLSFVYANGTSIAKYKIALGTVPSPDNLTPVSGNVYEPNVNSGSLEVGTAQTGGFGTIKSSSLEESTVDLATELTAMIQAQQSYQANSKVLQTGSDLMSVINALKT